MMTMCIVMQFQFMYITYNVRSRNSYFGLCEVLISECYIIITMGVLLLFQFLGK